MAFHGDTLEVLLSQNTLVHVLVPAALWNWALFACQRRPQLVSIRFLAGLSSRALPSRPDGDVRCGKQTVALEKREPIKVSHSTLCPPPHPHPSSTPPLYNSVRCRASLVSRVSVFSAPSHKLSFFSSHLGLRGTD